MLSPSSKSQHKQYYNINQGHSCYFLFMKKGKDIQWPFHVKRAKMKDSIIKCKQIIQNYSVIEAELKKNNYEMNEGQKESYRQYSKQRGYTTNNGVNQQDLLNNRIINFDLEEMKSLIKLYQVRKNKQAEQQMIGNGLAIKRINKDYISSRNVRAKTEYQQEKYSIKRQEEHISKKKQSKRSMLNIELQHIDLKSSVEPKEIQKWLVTKSIQSYIITDSHKFIKTEPIEQVHANLTTKERPVMLKIKGRAQSQMKQHQFKSKRPRQYLYEKMAQIKLGNNQRFNPIYQKRINSFIQFLWKIMIAHNIYLQLDLKEPIPFYSKQKVYITMGNNSNMIKGLMKRRFWWTIVDEYSDECTFVWSQLKIEKLFRKQESSQENKTVITRKMEQSSSQSLLISSTSRNKLTKQQIKKDQQEYQLNRKIWSKEDMNLFRYANFCRFSKINEDSNTSQNKDETYQKLTAVLNQNYKQITVVKLPKINNDIECEDQYYKCMPIVHNHLQKNYNLGNKKALFHNLKKYYDKIGDDLFSYVPLTFHIKNGFKDPQYKRFIKFYQNRNKLKEKQQQQDSTGSPSKHRNIWIVKPGQNSNRGRGITVIDQIYQLDNIIKLSQKNKNSILRNKNKTNPYYQSKTFIVQMYIDRPFLYNNRKFDIRHYMLITNLFGVTRAYWYQEGYVRTSSYQFNIHSFQEQIHLTNDAIQKQYLDYGKYQPYNKISYSEFQSYLNTFSQRHSFKEQIIPQMKKMGADAAKSVYTRITPHQQRHNFQIFGLDFMIDRNFKPWLIQINTNPCLDCSCPLLDRIIPYMVQQSLKLSIDVVYPPPSHYPNSYKHFAPFINLSSFKYELIFDSLAQGEQLNKLFSNEDCTDLDIGQIDDDEVFNSNGIQIKLQDYT